MQLTIDNTHAVCDYELMLPLKSISNLSEKDIRLEQELSKRCTRINKLLQTR